MATDGNDTVSVYSYGIKNASFDGGPGQDTLRLMGGGFFDLTQAASFANFEIIQGTGSHDDILVSGTQLAGVQTIDAGGGENDLFLVGPTVDLAGKSVLGFSSISLATDGMTVRTNSLDVALLLRGRYADNDGLILDGATLTDAQRLLLLDRGIDRITDASGVTTVNEAAQVSGLAGERIIVQNGPYILLDAGRDAVITDDRGAISSLSVSFRYPNLHNVDGRFILTATDRVTYETYNSFAHSVYVDGILIGEYRDVGEFSFTFNNNATPERVTEVLRAAAFQAGFLGYPPAAEAAVDIRVTDAGGRVTVTSMTLENANDAPVGLQLTWGRVAEDAKTGWYVGRLSAGDPNWGDYETLRFSLVDDAGGRFKIVGDQLVVADAAKIDYEQAKTHQVVIRVTDRRGLYQEKAYTITVTDVVAEKLIGTSGSEPLLGGRGKDSLYGGAGHDVLSGGTEDDVLQGGSGNDVLKGGASADRLYGGTGHDILFGGNGQDHLHGGSGKDAFAFTSTASRANVDRIADFNVRDDLIYLDNRIFTKLGKKGSETFPAGLSAQFFTVGEKAKDRNDYVIHDRKNGLLLYDADGSGTGHKAVEIATLSKNLTISASDFFVI
ncbi:calcium-binding protein [Microvirga arsenatis]|uniref:Cadherin domain-containing protein n=1 Tax=Microvirga arsenatis TaxID=2692265 RepID=A0ABW9Z2J6_9HYPH|nr:cadherin domain-containing protein [Microvirga arsenatis]NBJ13032.1 hypothetical protein [Microvirga arsenatis]NBJ26745.1 hypothetical protein [Microvirga arsenatis]